VTISPLPLIDVSDVPATWPDDVVDLTDRRRLLVLAVLGVDVPGPMVDRVFQPAGVQSSSSSSTTRRSDGRAPSTDAT
jgi:hypothetical protein